MCWIVCPPLWGWKLSSVTILSLIQWLAGSHKEQYHVENSVLIGYWQVEQVLVPVTTGFCNGQFAVPTLCTWTSLPVRQRKTWPTKANLPPTIWETLVVALQIPESGQRRERDGTGAWDWRRHLISSLCKHCGHFLKTDVLGTPPFTPFFSWALELGFLEIDTMMGFGSSDQQL